MDLIAWVNEGNVFFRPPLLLALVWFLWGINVWVFQKVHLDYCRVLQFDPATTLSASAICGSGLGIFAALMVLWFVYRLEWPFEDVLWIPSCMYIVAFFLLVIPLDVLHRKGRERLVTNLMRVFAPSPGGVLFVEVVLGDMLTSLSKALADLQVSLCVLLSHAFSQESPGHQDVSTVAGVAQVMGAVATGDGTSGMPSMPVAAHPALQAACAESLLRPLVTSLPFLLRFRQCIVAYRATGQAFPHLVNAAKYASAMPVIWISTFAHHFPDQYGLSARKMWLVAITFNSFFSFLWDVVMDFGLFRSETRHLFLRERLYYVSDGPAPRRLVFGPAAEAPDKAASSAPPAQLKPKSSGQDLGAFLDGEEANELRDGPAEADARMDDDGAETLAFLQDTTNHRADALADAASKAITIGGAAAPEGMTKRTNMSFDSGDALARSRRRSQNLRFPAGLASTGLTPPSPPNGTLAYPFHQPLLPQTPVFYYAAIMLDFLLRVLWSFKLSVHLNLTSEGLTFVLEMCEVLRRWLWLFFRIEWQCIELEDRDRDEDRASDLEQFAGDSLEQSKPSSPSTKPGWSVGSTGPLRVRTSSDRSVAMGGS